MKILILEDALIGEDVRQEAEKLGLEAKCFVGVKSVEGTKLTGFCRQGLTLEVVDLCEYELAFVDGFLYIDGMMGWDVLPHLQPLMYTVGTSSMGGIGAHHTIDKENMSATLHKFVEGELT